MANMDRTVRKICISILAICFEIKAFWNFTTDRDIRRKVLPNYDLVDDEEIGDIRIETKIREVLQDIHGRRTNSHENEGSSRSGLGRIFLAVRKRASVRGKEVQDEIRVPWSILAGVSLSRKVHIRDDRTTNEPDPS